MSALFSTASDRRWHIAVAMLIVVCAGGRLFYLTTDAAPDLAPDEAHYWDWSRHLDWSYYSKGPLVAWLIRASCELFGNTALAVRIPAILCGALLSAGLYTLTLQVFRSAQLGFWAVVVFASLPVLNIGGILITIDAPFTCCWCWALVFGYSAMLNGRRWAWPATGTMIALGILAKYTMLLWVGSAFLFLLMTPMYRRFLVRPGFWVMCLVGALGGLPILWWNASNGWVTFAHVGTQAGVTDSSTLKWLGPLEYVGGQLAVLLGFWFVGWVAAVWAWRKNPDPGIGYLWWMSVPTFVIFLLFSLTTTVQLNWPITAYLAGGVLTVGWIANKIDRSASSPMPSRRLWIRSATVACLIGIAVTVLICEIRPVRPLLVALAGEPTEKQPVPARKFDPTCRLRGWHHLAHEIDLVREDLASQGIDDPVIAGSRWVLPGELGFYCLDHPQVYAIGSYIGDRHSQYDLWRPNPLEDSDVFRGRTFIYVGGDEFILVRLGFDRVEPRRHVQYREQGELVSQWNVWVCHGFHGFPKIPPELIRRPSY